MTVNNSGCVLIFDLGEVVLTNDWLIRSSTKDREFYGYYGITEENFMRARSKFISRLQTGKISEESYWRQVLKLAHADSTDPAKAAEIMRKYQKPKPGMLSLLAKLRRRGFRLAALTVSHREILEYKIRKFRLNDYFELIVSSHMVGICKPDPRIFVITLKMLGVGPKGAIFIDDTPANIKAAEKLGIISILYKGTSDTEIKIGQLSQKR